MRKRTHEEFIEKLYQTNSYFRDGHFNIIGEYKNDSTPILLENKYGLCKSIPNNLYKNANPNFNSAVDKTAYFISKAKEIHGDRYDYSKCHYKNNETKVIIICDKHGEFTQTPHEHLSKCGCNRCGIESCSIKRRNVDSNFWTLSGWEKAAKASSNFHCYKIYIVELYDEESGEKFIKIGRTFTKTDIRMSPLPYSFKILKEWLFYNSDQAFDIEVSIKSLHKKYSYNPIKRFGGYSECFVHDIITETDILNDIGLSDVVGKILDYEYNP
jgi:hypothetical protein